MLKKALTYGLIGVSLVGLGMAFESNYNPIKKFRGFRHLHSINRIQDSPERSGIERMATEENSVEINGHSKPGSTIFYNEFSNVSVEDHGSGNYTVQGNLNGTTYYVIVCDCETPGDDKKSLYVKYAKDEE